MCIPPSPLPQRPIYPIYPHIMQQDPPRSLCFLILSSYSYMLIYPRISSYYIVARPSPPLCTPVLRNQRAEDTPHNFCSKSEEDRRQSQHPTRVASKHRQMLPPHPISSRARATFSDKNKAILSNLTSGHRSRCKVCCRAKADRPLLLPR